MKKNETNYKAKKGLIVLDPETGEKLDNVELQLKETKKHGREKGYFSIYIDEFDKIENLSSKEFSLLKYCINNRNQKTNIVNLGRKDILKRLSMQRQHFHYYKLKLIKENIITETDTKNQYLINPRFCCSVDSDTYLKMKLEYAKNKNDTKEIKRVKEEIKKSKNKDKLQKLDQLVNDNVLDLNILFEYLDIKTNPKN